MGFCVGQGVGMYWVPSGEDRQSSWLSSGATLRYLSVVTPGAMRSQAVSCTSCPSVSVVSPTTRGNLSFGLVSFEFALFRISALFNWASQGGFRSSTSISSWACSSSPAPSSSDKSTVSADLEADFPAGFAGAAFPLPLMWVGPRARAFPLASPDVAEERSCGERDLCRDLDLDLRLGFSPLGKGLRPDEDALVDEKRWGERRRSLSLLSIGDSFSGVTLPASIFLMMASMKVPICACIWACMASNLASSPSSGFGSSLGRILGSRLNLLFSGETFSSLDLRQGLLRCLGESVLLGSLVVSRVVVSSEERHVDSTCRVLVEGFPSCGRPGSGRVSGSSATLPPLTAGWSRRETAARSRVRSARWPGAASFPAPGFLW